MTNRFNKKLANFFNPLQNNKKPNEILTKLRAVFLSKDMTDETLKPLFISRLQYFIQLQLSARFSEHLPQLVQEADGIAGFVNCAQTMHPLLPPSESSVNTISNKAVPSNIFKLERENQDLKTQIAQLQDRLDDTFASKQFSKDKPLRSNHFKSNAFSKRRGGLNADNRCYETSTKALYFYHFKFGANANKCQSPCKWKERPLVATLGDNISHILCLKDLNTKEFFIIDTGSDYSIVKSNSFEIKNLPCDQYLIAANASKISTHGERIMKIKLSKNCFVKWKFVSAEVSHNIIGADFLEDNNLLRKLILVDANTQEKFPLINKDLVKENSPLLFVAECKFY